MSAVRGRTDVLALLRYLTEADARAAGPAAWSPWRAQLINGLADQVEGLLVDDTRRVELTQLVDVGLARSVQLDGRPRIKAESQPGGLQLTMASRDRLGLFSDTAGLLASFGIGVRSAVLHTFEGIAINTWRVDKQRVTDLPDVALLVKQLELLQAGDTAVLTRVRRREARAQQTAPADAALRRAGPAGQRHRGRGRGPDGGPAGPALRPRRRGQRSRTLHPLGAHRHPGRSGDRHLLSHTSPTGPSRTRLGPPRR